MFKNKSLNGLDLDCENIFTKMGETKFKDLTTHVSDSPTQWLEYPKYDVTQFHLKRENGKILSCCLF